MVHEWEGGLVILYLRERVQGSWSVTGQAFPRIAHQRNPRGRR